MIIECKKRAEGYKPVKGNEGEIMNHLLKHNYYNYWNVGKDNKIIFFDLGNGVFFTNEGASFFKCESDGKINHVWDNYDFTDYIAVPFDINSEDMLKIFHASNFVSFKRDGTVDLLLKNWSLKTTTETFAVSYKDIIIFDTDGKIVSRLMNKNDKQYESLLACNDYIVEQDD